MSSSDLKEFEQTNSANKEVLWAGVFILGLISYKFEDMPIRANCQAASLPASPPPTIATFFFDIQSASSDVSAIQATDTTFSSPLVSNTFTPEALLDCLDISDTEHRML